jgi:hypothetical protein
LVRANLGQSSGNADPLGHACAPGAGRRSGSAGIARDQGEQAGFRAAREPGRSPG